MASIIHAKERYQGAQRWVWALGGLLIIVAVWWVLAEMLAVDRPIVEYSTTLPSAFEQDSSGIDGIVIDRDSILRQDSINLANATEFERIYPYLPPPLHVLKAFPLLHKEDQLAKNTWISVWRNLQGYFWAVFLSLVLGFTIGLFPVVRALFGIQIDALRYLPLTALTLLFILWFGIGESMKVAFLSFGIMVYLLPVVLQRINEVEDVYLKTVFTLGANNWQIVKTVYFPAVLSKLMDDIRVLTAISWTYIIIAELLNRAGGVGAMIWLNDKYSKVDKIFAWLLVIIVVGFVQDRLLSYMDSRLFPHKYYKTVVDGLNEVKIGLLLVLGGTMVYLLLSAFLPAWDAVLLNILYITAISGFVAVLYGEFRFQRAYIA